MSEMIVETRDLSMRFGGVLAVNRVSFDVRRGEVFTLIGPNGAGKTTLFRMITGQEKPDKGTLTVGESVKIAYVDQSRDSLPADAPLWSAISDGQDMVHLGKVMVPARAYAARFGFTGDVQQRKVGVMSGGERNRIHLARLIKVLALCEDLREHWRPLYKAPSDRNEYLVVSPWAWPQDRGKEDVAHPGNCADAGWESVHLFILGELAHVIEADGEQLLLNLPSVR